MKKLGLFLCSVALLFGVTGCGNKKLECTVKEEDSKMVMKLNFDSKKNLKDGKVEATYTAGKEATDEEIKEAKDLLKSNFEEQGFKNVKVKNSGKTFKVTFSFDTKDFDKLGIEAEKATYDEILKSAEKEENVTCKKK